MKDIEEREEFTEWRVESDTTEDDFGTDEAGAREWVAISQQRVRDGEPHWEPVVLMSRTVVTEKTAWTEVTS